MVPKPASNLRRFGAALLVAGAIAGGFQPFLLRLLWIDREPFRRMLTRLPDRNTPGYPAFLQEVAQQTREGEKIAIVVPMRRWDDGYSYAYYRASYFLAGREVIPLVDKRDRLLTENLARAEAIASWRTRTAVRGFDIVWRGREGVLMRRRR